MIFRRGALAFLTFCATAVFAQTTQGLISGQLVNSVTGRPIAGANVLYSSSLSNLAGASQSDSSGYYYLPLLSPGFYQIRVNAAGFQSQEVQELELTVAARIELDFRLRPLSDVWESGQYNSVFLPGSKTIVTFYGPDVDPSKTGSFEAQKGRRAPLESTVSAGDRLRRDQQSSSGGPRCLHHAGHAARRYFRRRAGPRPRAFGQRAAALGVEFSAGRRGEQQLSDHWAAEYRCRPRRLRSIASPPTTFRPSMAVLRASWRTRSRAPEATCFTASRISI